MLSLWSDRLAFVFICCLIFVLPATVAGVAIFASLAILSFLVKKTAAVAAAFRDPRGVCRWQSLLSALALPYPAAAVSIFAGIFVLVCFISIFISVDPGASFEGFVGKTLKTALLFFAVQECMTTPSRVTWFLRACLVSAAILCLDGLWQLYSGVDVFKHYTLVDGRVNASLNHPNGLGAYLIVMIPLLAVMAFCWAARDVKGLWRKAARFFLAMAAVAVFMVVMGFTFSRGAWIGFACAGIVFLVFDKRTWVPCLILAGLFFLVFHPLLAQGRHVTLITDNVNSVGIENMGGTGRIQYWKDALRIVGDHPFFGTGLNTYTKVIKEYADINRNYAHNGYLQVAAELGMVGLAAIMGLFAAVFMLVRRKILVAEHGEGRLVLLALMAGWVGLLVESGLDNTFYSAQLSVLLWVVMGLIVVFPFTPGKGAVPCSCK